MTDSLHERVVAAIGHQYEIENEIGRGGMSVVYRARDIRLNRRVAIKVLPPELAYDTAIRARFTREAQTSAQLEHAHIVPIFDVGERDGIAYFVMAYVSGGSLGSLLAREPRQPIDDSCRILREVADALACAHGRGIIHRDIKPDNILLDADSGRAIVTDFGIARAMEAGTRLTVTGNAVGTPAYMSPEQATGEREVDGRSDLYSLGVVAYQMVTGRTPFTAGNSMALLLKHVGEPPRPIAELRPEAPRALREAIERALMKSPEDRWPTAASFRDALSGGEPAAPTWRAERREPVRYNSPIPETRRERGPERARATAAPSRRDMQLAGPQQPLPPGAPGERARGEIVMVPEHLRSFTPDQVQDLRIWHGRVDLYDRLKSFRIYFWYTLAMAGTAIGFTIAGLAEGVPPAIFLPIVPFYMGRKLVRRAKSLRAAGLKLRRVLLMPRAKWVVPKPAKPAPEQKLGKIAPREILESPLGAAIRRAAEDRAAILDMVRKLPKPDRALLPDVEPTANALVERVAHVAEMVHRLDEGFQPQMIDDLDARIEEVGRDAGSPDGERRLGLLRRQRGTLEELKQRREVLMHQLDSACVALGNLRYDLVKFRSSGLQSALTDVSTATQEARALSREIGVVLEAAAEADRL